MFLDSLIESNKRREPRHRWATLLSFTLQSAGIAALVLIPLLYTGALPPLRLGRIFVLPPPAAPRPSQNATPPGPVTSEPAGNAMQAPPRIPMGISKEPAPAPPAIGRGGIGVEGGVGTPLPSAVDPIIATLLKPPDTLPTHARPTPPDVSHLMEGRLIRRVEPEYPSLAKATRTQGAVVLTAVIDKEGRIEHLQVVSGHPLMVGAAMAAVRQWRYRPYLLNGQPVEVTAEITINFRLGG